MILTLGNLLLQIKKNARQTAPFTGRKFIYTYPNLKGDDIACWQDQVGGLVIDGYYKKEDAERCKQIQAQHHLEINGIVDEQVWNLSFGREE